MKLKLDAFRGVSQPFTVEFETKQDLTILDGELGSGKTTISHASEFVIDGTSDVIYRTKIPLRIIVTV